MNQTAPLKSITSHPAFAPHILRLFKEIARAVPAKQFLTQDNHALHILLYTQKSRGAAASTIDSRQEGLQFGYDPDDIHIRGGAAFHIYDYAFEEYRQRKGLPESSIILNRRLTEDVDLDWWPSSNILLAIVPSKSPGIMRFAEAFTEKARAFFTKPDIVQLLKGIVQDYTGIQVETFSTEVNYTHILMAGVHTISVTFNVNGQKQKVCELAIHDNGSSQQVGFDGRPVGIADMRTDPSYTDPANLQTVRIGRTSAVVPRLDHYILQQGFGLLNMFNQGEEMQRKAIALFRRMYYLSIILHSAHSDNINSINGVDLRNGLISYFNISMIMRSRHREALAQLCRGLNSVAEGNNIPLRALCSMAGGARRTRRQRHRS